MQVSGVRRIAGIFVVLFGCTVLALAVDPPAIEWVVDFDRPDTTYVTHKVRQTRDGGYIIVGWDREGGDGGFLLKTDMRGQREWEKNYGTELFDVAQTSDIGYVDFSAGGNVLTTTIKNA